MRRWYPWLLVGITLGFSVAVYGRLPERVPTHWDFAGEINGWSPRPVGALIIPALLALMALLLPWLPSIDPRRANYEKFQPTYTLVVNAVLTTMAALHVAMLGSALGWPVSMQRVTPIAVGALFIVLGNVMPRARPNWWFGIRTPWTLTNDRVWERTHRLGGFLFVAAGLALVLLTFAPARLFVPTMVVVIVAASVVPLVYSYVIWKQETSR